MFIQQNDSIEIEQVNLKTNDSNLLSDKHVTSRELMRPLTQGKRQLRNVEEKAKQKHRQISSLYNPQLSQETIKNKFVKNQVVLASSGTLGQIVDITDMQ